MKCFSKKTKYSLSLIFYMEKSCFEVFLAGICFMIVAVILKSLFLLVPRYTQTLRQKVHSQKAWLDLERLQCENNLFSRPDCTGVCSGGADPANNRDHRWQVDGPQDSTRQKFPLYLLTISSISHRKFER